MQFSIYIADPYNSLSSYVFAGISQELGSLFNYSVKGKSMMDSIDGLAVYPAYASSHIVDSDFLVYVMPRKTSIVARIGPVDTTKDGSTVKGGSEVYVNGNWSPKAYARLIIHEMMHNKMRLHNSQLHPKGGLAAREVEESIMPTAVNIADISKFVSSKKPKSQWTDGLRILSHASGDVMSEFKDVNSNWSSVR